MNTPGDEPPRPGRKPGRRPPPASALATPDRQSPRPMPAPGARVLARRDLRLLAACTLFTAGAGVFATVPAGPVVPFVVSAVALALLATLVGRAVDALGDLSLIHISE